MKMNLFNSVKLTKPKRNNFDLSHDVKLSGDMGNLIPVLALDTVPGDKFNLSCESVIRFAPMLAPIMHRVDVSIHYFFVPNRILWPNWDKFISEPTETYVAPYINYNSTYTNYNKFLDYFGVPPMAVSGNIRINALPFSAYQCVYNEYYRDQNLVSAVDYKLVDGNNSTTTTQLNNLLTLRKRAWEHDYFTASLPFAQKGPAADIPIGTVELDTQGITPAYWKDADSRANILTGDVTSNTTGGNLVGGNFGVYDPNGSLQVQPTTINELRRAFKLQEWLERNARGGTRYVENILAHFGVKSSDARLQRPEYITGTKSPVVISEVLNTTGTTGQLPQGNMAGHGVSVTGGKYGNYYCEEHGWIIGVMSVMPKTAYQQGLPKMFQKFDNLDYFWPSFAHIGEQEVQESEIYIDSTTPTNTFGYVPRYAEYKYMPSRVAGQFRTTLDYWHLGRKFSTKPVLNQAFIECDPAATKRIFAVTSTNDSLYCHIYHKISAIRPMPKFGNPTL